jgi:hypothetical protein
MYIVTTSNMDGDCPFETLQGALNFIKDQIEMGFPCSIKEQITCEICAGTGGRSAGDDVRPCTACNGTGIYTYDTARK